MDKTNWTRAAVGTVCNRTPPQTPVTQQQVFSYIYLRAQAEGLSITDQEIFAAIEEHKKTLRLTVSQPSFQHLPYSETRDILTGQHQSPLIRWCQDSVDEVLAEIFPEAPVFIPSTPYVPPQHPTTSFHTAYQPLMRPHTQTSGPPTPIALGLTPSTSSSTSIGSSSTPINPSNIPGLVPSRSLGQRSNTGAQPPSVIVASSLTPSIAHSSYSGSSMHPSSSTPSFTHGAPAHAALSPPLGAHTASFAHSATSGGSDSFHPPRNDMQPFNPVTSSRLPQPIPNNPEPMMLFRPATHNNGYGSSPQPQYPTQPNQDWSNPAPISAGGYPNHGVYSPYVSGPPPRTNPSPHAQVPTQQSSSPGQSRTLGPVGRGPLPGPPASTGRLTDPNQNFFASSSVPLTRLSPPPSSAPPNLSLFYPSQPPHGAPMTGPAMPALTVSTSAASLLNPSLLRPSTSPIPGLTVSRSAQSPVTLPPQPKRKTNFVPSTTAAIAPVRDKICAIFAKRYFCDKSCQENHPYTHQVCWTVIRSKNCVSATCQLQHPNEVTMHLLIEKACTELKITAQEWVDQLEEKDWFMYWKSEKEDCPDGSDCLAIGCKKSHRKWRASDLSSDLPFVTIGTDDKATTTGPEFELVDVTSNEQHVALIKEILARSRTHEWTLTKVQHVRNRKLTTRFNKFKTTKSAEIGRIPIAYKACHGTKAEGWKNIPRDGFIAKFRQRNLYGEGHYFAIDPSVAHYFSAGHNLLIICDILMEAHNFEASQDYFIVPDDDAINPVYLVEYTATSTSEDD